MSTRDEILTEILAEADAPAIPAAKPHRFRRLAGLTLSASAVAIAGLMFVGPASPASASCSDWMTPSRVAYTHSKTCGLGIREYDYDHRSYKAAGHYCYYFTVRQFVCADWYAAGTASWCS